MQKLDIFGNKVFVHDNDRLYYKLCCNVISPATLARVYPVTSRVKKIWRQEVALFGQTATNFGKERFWVLKGSNLPQISPKWKIISPRTAPNQPKLRSATSQFSGGLNIVY